jgi:serine/threonine protein kinase
MHACASTNIMVFLLVPNCVVSFCATNDIYYRAKFKDFNDETTKRSFIDGIVSERVSSAKNALNTYGFCAHSSFIEIAAHGELEDLIAHEDTYAPLTSKQKLQMVLDMARGVAEVHYGPQHVNRMILILQQQQKFNGTLDPVNLEADVAILDIKPSNMLIMKDGTVKVSDFNNAELLQRNITNTNDNNSSSLCDFRIFNDKSPVSLPHPSITVLSFADKVGTSLQPFVASKIKSNCLIFLSFRHHFWTRMSNRYGSPVLSRHCPYIPISISELVFKY